MRTKALNLIFLLFFLLSENGLSGQSQSLKRFTVHDGLVQQQVLDLYEDSRGYLWIGTKIGVSKFNGESFENFKTSDGLLDDYNRRIVEDSKGNIWFGSTNGLTKFDGKNFEQFPLEGYGGIDYMEINNKDEILFRRKKTLFPSLFRFDGEKFNIVGDSISNPETKGNGVAFDKENQRFVFAIRNQGIFSIKDDSIYQLDSIPKMHSMILDKQTQKIHVREFDSDSLYYYSYENGLLKKLYHVSRKGGLPTNLDFSSFSENYYTINDGKIWKVEPKNSQFKEIQSAPFSFPTNKIVDKSGRLWIGTDEGLFHYNSGTGFTHYESKDFQYIWSITEDKSGRKWLSSYNSGLRVLDKGKIKEITEHNHLFPNGKGRFYFGSLMDKNENLLFPTHNNILKYDGKKFSIIQSSGKTNDVNLQLYEDQENGLLFSGVSGGVNIFEDYKLKYSFHEKDGIHPNGYIVAIQKDKNGHYWLGSYLGLSCLDLENKTFKNYTIENEKLPSKGAISIAKDSRGNMWFAGQGGLMTYDYEADTILRLAPSLNQTGSVVFTASDDLLVLGLTDGLYFIDLNFYYEKGEVKYKYFNHKNGYLGIEPGQNGTFEDSKGNFWVASSLSVDVFHPDKIDLSTASNKAAVVKLNGERIPYGVEQIDLPKGENALKFNFEGIGSNGTFQTQYAYKLDGVDENWSDWSVDEFAFYDNLGSDTYTFHLKSKLGSTIQESDFTDSINVKVDLSFWKEPEFYKATLIILIGCFFLLVLAMSERFRYMAVAEKTKKIQFLNKEISHRVKNNLSFVASMIDMQRRRVKEAPAQNALSETSMRIQAMSSLYRGLYQSEETKVNMKDYLTELIGNLQDFFQQDNKEVHLKLEVTGNNLLESEKAMLVGLIINECVTNAAKYAFEGVEKPIVEIKYSTDSGDSILIVSDNGVGIDKIEEFHQSKSFGITLINNFVDQLKGKLNISSSNGLNVKIIFPT